MRERSTLTRCRLVVHERLDVGRSWTVEDREQFWQAHIDACRMSGITQKAYCERHDITPKTFRIWRTRLAAAARVVASEGEQHGRKAGAGGEEFFRPLSDASSDQAHLVNLLTNPRLHRTWTPEEKQRIVVDALRSGLSINRFARISGLTSSVLYRWRQELAARVRQGHAVPQHDPPQHSAAAPMHAAVSATPAPSDPAPPTSCCAVDAPARDTVEVVLANGRRVRFHARADARPLRALLAALESSA